MDAKSKCPGDPGKLNAQRAQWAAAALDKHDRGIASNNKERLVYLLCNLRHWADRHDVDFGEASGSARALYEGETLMPVLPPKKKSRR